MKIIRIALSVIWACVRQITDIWCVWDHHYESRTLKAIINNIGYDNRSPMQTKQTKNILDICGGWFFYILRDYLIDHLWNFPDLYNMEQVQYGTGRYNMAKVSLSGNWRNK